MEQDNQSLPIEFRLVTLGLFGRSLSQYFRDDYICNMAILAMIWEIFCFAQQKSWIFYDCLLQVVSVVPKNLNMKNVTRGHVLTTPLTHF
jgi:hypothetical protein